jgi:hypothetical protein
MKPRIGRDPETGQDCLLYDCEQCKYTHILLPTYGGGKCVPTASFDKKGLKEGLLGHARA